MIKIISSNLKRIFIEMNSNLPIKKRFKYLHEEEEIEQDDIDKEHTTIHINTQKTEIIVPKARKTIKLTNFTDPTYINNIHIKSDIDIDDEIKSKQNEWTICSIS